MTPEEAKETLEMLREYCICISDLNKAWDVTPLDIAVALDIAIAAIDKQIAVKPIINSGNWCAACGHSLYNGKATANREKYCECGQKIDWSSEDKK